MPERAGSCTSCGTSVVDQNPCDKCADDTPRKPYCDVCNDMGYTEREQACEDCFGSGRSRHCAGTSCEDCNGLGYYLDDPIKETCTNCNQ